MTDTHFCDMVEAIVRNFNTYYVFLLFYIVVARFRIAQQLAVSFPTDLCRQLNGLCLYAIKGEERGIADLNGNLEFSNILSLHCRY